MYKCIDDDFLSRCTCDGTCDGTCAGTCACTCSFKPEAMRNIYFIGTTVYF